MGKCREGPSERAEAGEGGACRDQPQQIMLPPGTNALPPPPPAMSVSLLSPPGTSVSPPSSSTNAEVCGPTSHIVVTAVGVVFVVVVVVVVCIAHLSLVLTLLFVNVMLV